MIFKRLKRNKVPLFIFDSIFVFEARAEIHKKDFVGILVEMMTPTDISKSTDL